MEKIKVIAKMNELQVMYDSEHEVSKNHLKLIEAVSQLDKKQR